MRVCNCALAHSSRTKRLDGEGSAPRHVTTNPEQASDVAQIDILIPLFNAADTLDASLASLAEQSFTDFRVILIDDGSTDATGAILARWAARDARFTVITKPNSGIVDSLNMGLAAVTAPFVARLDGDDIALPARLAEQHAYLALHPGCVAVGCRVQHIDGAGKPLPGFPQPGDPQESDMWRLPAREPYIVHPFLMARTDALRAVGGYRRVPHSEDSDLFWRLSELGTLHNLPQTLGQYRMHMESISGSSILNGRVMAVGSQLGAVSAQRRCTGVADVPLGPDLIDRLRQAGQLEAMAALVSPMLTVVELPHFRLAIALKLLELANYRPYEIESSDCAFLNATLEPAIQSVGRENLIAIDWFLTQTASRLARRGRVRDALTLVPRRLWVRTALKVLLRR